MKIAHRILIVAAMAACPLGALADVEHFREAQSGSMGLVHQWDFQGPAQREQLSDRVGSVALQPQGQQDDAVVAPALSTGNTALTLPSPNNAVWLETREAVWPDGFAIELLLKPGTNVDATTVILDASDTDGNHCTLVQDREGIAWIVGSDRGRRVRLIGSPSALSFHPERWYYLCIGLVREDVGSGAWRYRISAYGRDLDLGTPMTVITQETPVAAGRIVGPRRLLIARDVKNRTSRWDGRMDELAIYREPLSQQDAQSHAQAVLAVVKKQKKE